MESEVLTAFHVGRGLNHEQTMMFVGPGWTHEWTNTNKAIGSFETQALRIKRFRLERVLYEVNNMG
ncbi:hypothetical protein D3C75_1297590 [compost metagenome]